jgi:Carboxypeptidase regulatory-like domain
MLAAVPLLLAGACAAPPYPGTQAVGTVTGRVLSWPCTPGPEIAGSPCPGKPVAGVHIDFSRNGSVMGQAVSDSSGGYSIQLLPGTYSVLLKNVGLVKTPFQVTVTAGQVTNQDFVFDNGMR